MADTDNVAVVLHGVNDIRIEKWPMPVINKNEVLIRMHSVGICGSDVKMYSTGRCGLERVSRPIVLGHEGAGVVVEVGAEVSNLKVGDRVAIEPTQPCRGCALCKAGRYNLCDRPRYCSTEAHDGNLCRFYKHIADFCYKLPDKLSMEEGAALQPLAIALHAVRRARVRLGDAVLVMGAGPVGVLCAASARAAGAARILITDVGESRLEAARALCAADTLLTRDLSEEDEVARALALLGGRPDVTIDACGYGCAQRVAMMATRAGGVVLVVGIADAEVTVPLSGALLREVDIRGSYRIANTYPAAMAAVSSGAMDLKGFITHHFRLEEARAALELAKTGRAMKIIIHV